MSQNYDFDYYNNHYKHVNKNFNFEIYKKTIFEEHLDILSKEKKILDIGCGEGFLLKTLESEGFLNLFGVESDKNQFKRAKINLKNTKLFQLDAITFLRKNKIKFDIIFLYDILEHIEKKNVLLFLKLIHKNLNLKGIVLIKTPNADSPFFSTRNRYLDFTHEISFNKESISMVLREAGFSEIKCKSPKNISLKKEFILPIRIFFELLIRIYMATYIGNEAFSLIFQPNFIIEAKK